MDGVVGVASAAVALLQRAIDIFGRIRDAHKRQKDLAKVLDSHKEELTTTMIIVQTIRDENALQTASVVSELFNIEAIVKRLIDLLKTLEPGNKGALRQLTHQLVQRSKYENKLAAIMAELTHSKCNLSLKMQVVNVGLTCTAQNTIVANAAVVKQINTIPQKVLGEGQELEIARLLRDRSPGSDGMISLSDADLTSLIDKAASSVGSSPAGANSAASGRVISENLTQDQALQINGLIGQKEWQDASHLEIQGNKASGTSVQVNGAITDGPFKDLLAAHVQIEHIHKCNLMDK